MAASATLFGVLFSIVVTIIHEQPDETLWRLAWSEIFGRITGTVECSAAGSSIVSTACHSNCLHCQ